MPGERRDLAYLQSSTSIANFTTLENDEFSWGVEPIIETFGDLVPVVLDVHHYWISEGVRLQPSDPLVNRIRETWRGVQPKLHLAMSYPELCGDYGPKDKMDLQALLDAGTFQMKGGTPWFDKAMKITQNSQNQNYAGWSQIESPRNRGVLISAILSEQNSTLRNFYYNYHRTGLDNLAKADQISTKQIIASELMKLKFYDNNFQMNYPFNIFIESKKDEIFNIFNSNNNGSVNMSELKQLMNTFSPKDSDSKWNKWN
jgi:hypothetical protein